MQQVRARVLQLISQEDASLFDEEDVDENIVKSDALINMFSRRYDGSSSSNKKKKSEDGQHLDKVCHKLMETLKWRKSSGLTQAQAQDFPLDIWMQNPVAVYEDDETFVGVNMMHYSGRISGRWTELRLLGTMWFFDRFALQAYKQGKRVVILADARRETSYMGLDVRFNLAFTKLLDRHFPFMMDVFGIYGVPAFLAPIVTWFIRFAMPTSLKEIVQAYTPETIVDAFGGEEQLPRLFGGKIPLIDPLPAYLAEHPGMKSLKEVGLDDVKQKWSLEEWEITRIQESCQRQQHDCNNNDDA